MSISLLNLKESNDFLNSIIDNMTSALFVVDKEVKVQNMNDSFQALFQKSREQIFGRYCGNAIGCSFTVNENKDCGNTSQCNTCELRKSILKAFTQKIPSFREKLEREIFINGQMMPKIFLYSTKYITFDNEEMILIIVDDITEIENQKKQLEVQNVELQNLNKLKNEFLGIAAHDLRNPIGVVQMYSAFILQSLNKNLTTEQEKFIQTILKSSEFVLKLLNDLLDISKIEAGKIDLVYKEDDYVQCVRDNIDLNSIVAKNKGIKIVFILKNEIQKFFFDRNKIEQVLNNLISNAIKYSFGDTTITVEISAEDDYVMTRVIDQGQGIPAHELSKVFKAFQKTSVRSTAGEKSTGLGLAIVKKIIESHRGEIGVESIVGIGSTFYYKLPRNLRG